MHSSTSEIGLAIELYIAQSSKRIDFLLTGRDESQAKNAILIELKQWSKASASDCHNGERENSSIQSRAFLG